MIPDPKCISIVVGRIVWSLAGLFINWMVKVFRCFSPSSCKSKLVPFPLQFCRQVRPCHCECCLGNDGFDLIANWWSKYYQKQGRKAGRGGSSCDAKGARSDLHPSAAGFAWAQPCNGGQEISHVLQCAWQVAGESYEPFLHWDSFSRGIRDFEAARCFLSPHFIV